MKTCTECKQQKPLDDYYFEKGKPRAKCKDCHKAKVYGRRDSNPEEFKEYMAQWRANHRDILAARERERRQREGDKINAARRERRENDVEYRDRQRATHKASRDRYPERIAARNRAYYEANKESLSAAERLRRAENIDRYLAREKAWRDNNRDRIKAYNQEYYEANSHKWVAARAKRQQIIDSFPPVNRREILERDGGQCRCCGTALTVRTFELDHIVPLSLGGAHERYNLQALCRPCNRRKWANLEGQVSLPV